MSHVLPTRLPPTLLALGIAAAGCAEPAGEEIGSYRVTMSLASNTCGPAAVNLQDGRRYTVQLRADGEQGFWRLPGQPPLMGSYGEGSFKFTYSSLVARSAPDAGTFCQLVQDEELVGAVAGADDEDAGAAGSAKSIAPKGEEEFAAPAQGLVGRHVFHIKAAAGTDCRDALPPEGPFERLPCTVSYDLIGSPTDSF